MEEDESSGKRENLKTNVKKEVHFKGKFRELTVEVQRRSLIFSDFDSLIIDLMRESM